MLTVESMNELAVEQVRLDATAADDHAQATGTDAAEPEVQA